MKKILMILLSILVIMSMLPSALAVSPTLGNFREQREYKDRFIDVRASDWFYSVVKLGYEIGLIDGTSETSYTPSNNVTLAEIITLASRLNSIYGTGEASFTQGSPWYQVYVDYAEENGFLLQGLDSYTRPALRGEVAAILAGALPDAALSPMNTVEDNALPDVKMSAAYSKEIYALYRAGVLTGSDSEGTFHPNNEILRSEIAAIVSRMAVEESRVSVAFYQDKGDTDANTSDGLNYCVFDCTVNRKYTESIQGISVFINGKVDSVKVSDFTEMELTRDGKRVDNLLIFKGLQYQDKWGDGSEYSVFSFQFKQEIMESGRYIFTGKYQGKGFVISEVFVEASFSDATADPEALDFAYLFGINNEVSDQQTSITGLVIEFKGQQQNFNPSDLTNMKLTFNGTEIDFVLQEEWFRFLFWDDQLGAVVTDYSLDFENGGFVQPGTYQMTGLYKGKPFTSIETVIS